MHAVTYFFWICKDFSDDIEAKNVNSKKIPVDLNSELKNTGNQTIEPNIWFSAPCQDISYTNKLKDLICRIRNLGIHCMYDLPLHR